MRSRYTDEQTKGLYPVQTNIHEETLLTALLCRLRYEMNVLRAHQAYVIRIHLSLYVS